MTKKKKLLIISWAVYPDKTGSAVLLENIANNFSGNDLIIIGEGTVAYEEINRNKNNPKIYYISPPFKSVKRIGKYLKWFGIINAIIKTKKIIKKEECNILLTVFPDEFYLFLGYYLSKKLGLPFYTWFHNTYAENRKGVRKYFATWLQPRVFKHAKTNFVISAGLEKYYKKKYPNLNFSVLLHGFNMPKIKFKEFHFKNKDNLSFVYTGTLNDSCLDASLRLCKTIIKNPKYKLHIYGDNNKINFKRNKIDGINVYFHGHIPSSEFITELQKHDVLLLPLGLKGNLNDVEYETIFPTRTIPLLFSNRPVLAHVPKKSYLGEFLVNNKCAEVVSSPNEESILEAIKLIVYNEDYCNTLIKNSLNVSSLFDIKNTLQVLYIIIESNEI